MPIYEYRCNECDELFEVLTTSGPGTEEVHCRKCNSQKVTKVISAGFIRSGSGTSLPSAPPRGCAAKSGFS